VIYSDGVTSSFKVKVDKMTTSDHAPLLPTPDWKTLKPGKPDSDIYTEQSGCNDAIVTGWDGRNVFGVTIGLVQMHVNLAMIPGNMGNGTTFDFPILYRRMNANDVADVMANPPSGNFTDAIVEAAQWLELQGVRAIMGNCGFFGSYQNEVKARINVPFFSSSLMMLPMMVHSMPGNKKIGVITANGPVLSEVQAIENCGLSQEDKENRIVVMGCENGEEFSSAIMANTGVYNPHKVEQEIVAVAKAMVAENDDIGAILLECTELSPHAVAVQNAVRLPVWDYTTLTKWIYSGCIRRPFTGHI
jgi:aspartate/glutamate racemase